MDVAKWLGDPIDLRAKGSKRRQDAQHPDAALWLAMQAARKGGRHAAHAEADGGVGIIR
jgi:hypothetical protein